MPRAGGPIVDVVEFPAQRGVACSGSASEFYYTRDNAVWTVAPGGKPGKVFASKNDVANLVVGNGSLIKSETGGPALIDLVLHRRREAEHQPRALRTFRRQIRTNHPAPTVARKREG